MMDVADYDEFGRVVRMIETELGPIDILVNNAAVMDNLGKFEDQKPERLQRDLNVNLTGAYNCSKAVWPRMVKKEWGRIINISSVAGLASWELICSHHTVLPKPG
jgi:3-oxoacyl-[acyl-carrier protein] reductase